MTQSPPFPLLQLPAFKDLSSEGAAKRQKIQKGPTGAALFGGIVAFNSLEEAVAGHEDPRYQAALAELGEDPEETVVRTLAIFEGA